MARHPTSILNPSLNSIRMSSYSSSVSPGFWSEGAPSHSTRSSRSRDADPPRPPRDGFEWVWFPAEGYWAERPSSSQKSPNEDQGRLPVGGRPSKIFRWGSRTSKSPKDVPELFVAHHDSMRTTECTPPSNESQHPFWQLPKDVPLSPFLSEQEQVAALQQGVKPMPGLRPDGPHVRDTWKSIDTGAAVPLAEMLDPGSGARKSDAPVSNRLSWRRSFHKTNLSEESKGIPEESRVEATPADTAPSYFNVKPILRPSEHTPPHTPPTGGGSGGRPGSKRVSFSGSSHDPPPYKPTELSSVSKGLRKWLMQKIPLGRRIAETTGSPKEKWEESSEPSSPASSTFAFNRPVDLPDANKSYPAGVSNDEEAKHVPTPPLKKDTADGKPRSLFIDLKHADIEHVDGDDERDASKASTDDNTSDRMGPRVFSYRKGQTSEPRQWWDEPKAAVRRDPVKDVSFFEFNLPEHLPTSPICPANPMHKGRGKLVCVTHGRAKASTVPNAEADVAKILDQ